MTQEDKGRGVRIVTAVAVFLCSAAALVLLVSHRYLLPALAAARGADPIARKQLAAISWLVLIAVLVCLLGMLIVLFRPGRMFLPRKTEPRTRTKYVDAWAEAGKRLQPTDESDDDGPAGPDESGN
ncbi:MAG: hypothetical protein ABSH20_06740 [Tepidisphaeraceae bacterium]|jgi:hypothetical protein